MAHITEINGVVPQFPGEGKRHSSLMCDESENWTETEP